MTVDEALALAIQRHQAGNLDEAGRLYREILAVVPDHAAATHLLGVADHQTGQEESAIALIEKAIRLHGNDPSFHNNLGEVHRTRGRFAQALDCYENALRLNPDSAETHYNVGLALHGLGRFADAIESYRRAVELQPDFASAHNNLGLLFQDRGDFTDAAIHLRRAVELRPTMARYHGNLGAVLQCQGNHDEAGESLEHALRLDPDLAQAHHNLGNVRHDQGRIDEAIACFQEAVRLDPANHLSRSTLLYLRLFQPGLDMSFLHEEHSLWNRLHAEPFAASRLPRDNDRDPDRRLRIGYVSPDLRDHVVGRNLVPLIREHDRDRYAIYCYAGIGRSDPIADRLRGDAEVWRGVLDLSDDRLAERIREDRIDILVDLSLHMANHRLLVFARKPAPVQVTFAGYPGTTGLTAIDYRLTDPHLDPSGLFDAYYSEESVRLPDSFWCFDPIDESPDVNALPALSRGKVTFGCFNSCRKVNPNILRIWARTLKSVERSELELLAVEGRYRQATRDLFAREGVDPERVTFRKPCTRPEYLRLHGGIDVALDPFPYNGHTTSLDALWMGVPVVGMLGDTVAGRASFSQLTNLGLSEWVATSADEYVGRAIDLAGDLARLSELRRTVRERMRRAPLLDAPTFARGVEAAYRMMWRRWCAARMRGEND